MSTGRGSDNPSIPLGQEASGLISELQIEYQPFLSVALERRTNCQEISEIIIPVLGRTESGRQVVTALLLAILEASQLQDAALTSLHMLHPGRIFAYTPNIYIYIYVYTHAHTHRYIYIYIYMCVCYYCIDI